MPEPPHVAALEENGFVPRRLVRSLDDPAADLPSARQAGFTG